MSRSTSVPGSARVSRAPSGVSPEGFSSFSLPPPCRAGLSRRLVAPTCHVEASLRRQKPGVGGSFLADTEGPKADTEAVYSVTGGRNGPPGSGWVRLGPLTIFFLLSDTSVHQCPSVVTKKRILMRTVRL